jgi:sec-independent protein translocase protein TatA
MRNFGMGELLIILVVVLLLFGAKKLPDLARSLGRSLNEFKKGRDEGTKPEDTADKKTDEEKKS